MFRNRKQGVPAHVHVFVVSVCLCVCYVWVVCVSGWKASCSEHVCPWAVFIVACTVLVVLYPPVCTQKRLCCIALSGIAHSGVPLVVVSVC